MFISKLYRQMYANTGIVTDSARRERRIAGRGCWPSPCRLFQAKPMPELAVPGARQSAFQIVGQ